MKRNQPILMFVTVLAIAALACNMPTAQEPSADATEVSTEEPAEVSTEAPEAAQTEVPAEEDSKLVSVSVSTATNCRTGPDVVYQLLMTVQPGSDFTVVGKYTPKGYWIINMPTGGTCWLWGQYAIIQGDASVLPEITPPPAPVAQSPNSDDSNQTNNSNNNDDEEEEDNSQPAAPSPAAPTNVDITRQCTTLTQPNDLFPSFKMVVQFTWTDASNNETGFNIFKDGAFYTTLPANTQKFSETFTVLLAQTPTVTYGVQSVNANGGSATVTGTVNYCN